MFFRVILIVLFGQAVQGQNVQRNGCRDGFRPDFVNGQKVCCSGWFFCIDKYGNKKRSQITLHLIFFGFQILWSGKT